MLSLDLCSSCGCIKFIFTAERPDGEALSYVQEGRNLGAAVVRFLISCSSGHSLPTIFRADVGHMFDEFNMTAYRALRQAVQTYLRAVLLSKIEEVKAFQSDKARSIPQ